MNDFVLQLWSGTFGAALGAIVGAVSAILVLYFTTKHQTSLSEEALESQRDEARRGREIEAVSGLLQRLGEISSTPQADMAFVPELVRRCDLLTLNSPPGVAKHWRTPHFNDGLGVTRHPIAEAVATAFALQQVAPVVRLKALEHFDGAGIPSGHRQATHSAFGSTNSIAKQIQSISSVLLRWPELTSDQKVQFCASFRSNSRRAAVHYCDALAGLKGEPVSDGHHVLNRWTSVKEKRQAVLIGQAGAMSDIGIRREEEAHGHCDPMPAGRRDPTHTGDSITSRPLGGSFLRLFLRPFSAIVKKS